MFAGCLQVVMWLNQNFLLVDEYSVDSSGDSDAALDATFLCLRALPQQQLLRITMDHSGQVLVGSFVPIFMNIDDIINFK